MRVLWLADALPAVTATPCGVERPAAHALHALASDHEVVLAAFASEEDAATRLASARAFCERVEVVQRPRGVLSRLWVRASRVVPNDMYPPAPAPEEAMRQLIRRLLRTDEFDAIHVGALSMAGYVPPWDARPRVLDLRAHEWRTSLSTFWPPRERGTRLQRQRLAQAARAASVTLVSSEHARGMVESAVGAPWSVHVVPLATDVDAADDIWHARHPSPSRLLAFGSLLDERAQWCLRDAYPSVLRALPGTRLDIVADDRTGAPPRLPFPPGVRLAAPGDDVDELLAQASALLVPGTDLAAQCEILRGLATGIPVVATSTAAVNLDIVPGEHLLTAETPTGFAAAILRLLGDATLMGDLLLRGRALARDRFTVSRMRADLSAAYAHALRRDDSCALCS